jgi:hypothetical protein
MICLPACAQANPVNVAGMAPYGISTYQTLGVSIYELRRIAKTVEPSHDLAEELWASGIHGRASCYIERPEWVSEDRWNVGRWISIRGMFATRFAAF